MKTFVVCAGILLLASLAHAKPGGIPNIFKGDADAGGGSLSGSGESGSGADVGAGGGDVSADSDSNAMDWMMEDDDEDRDELAPFDKEFDVDPDSVGEELPGDDGL